MGYQRVVTHHAMWAGKAFEEPRAIVVYFGNNTVCRGGSQAHFPTFKVHHSLHAKAHAEDWAGEFTQHIGTNSQVGRIGRATRPRRDDSGVVKRQINASPRDVIRDNRGLTPGYPPNVVHEIEGKRIVVIYDQQVHNRNFIGGGCAG